MRVASEPNLVVFYKGPQSRGGLAIQTRWPCPSFCIKLPEPHTQKSFPSFELLYEIYAKNSPFEVTQHGLDFHSLS